MTWSSRPRIRVKPPYSERLARSLTVAPAPARGFCWLSLLHAFVREHQAAVERMLVPQYQELPLMDRVLLLLVPEMEHDVVRYHAGQGPDLAAMFVPHQLEHLDRDLVSALRGLIVAYTSRGGRIPPPAI